jgi:hypothetical protein
MLKKSLNLAPSTRIATTELIFNTLLCAKIRNQESRDGEMQMKTTKTERAKTW